MSMTLEIDVILYPYDLIIIDLPENYFRNIKFFSDRKIYGIVFLNNDTYHTLYKNFYFVIGDKRNSFYLDRLIGKTNYKITLSGSISDILKIKLIS